MDKATASAERGDRKAEEAAIFDARSVASKSGLTSRGKARRSFDALVQERMEKGLLRRGATRIGLIPASAQRPTSKTVTDMMTAGLYGHQDLEVFSDRLIHGGTAYLLDGRESTALELDGQVVTSSRPTMTRMAAGSILPGSALLAGLAFQKKTTTDTRKAQLLIANPEWQLTLEINPESIAGVRPIVAQLEASIRELERRAAAQAEPVAQPVGTGTMADRLTQLERVAALLESGAITADEAMTLRAEILKTES